MISIAHSFEMHFFVSLAHVVLNLIESIGLNYVSLGCQWSILDCITIGNNRMCCVYDCMFNPIVRLQLNRL